MDDPSGVVVEGDLIHIPIKRHGCDVVLTLEIYQDGDATVCGLRFLTGTMPNGPKAALAAVRAELPHIEQMARAADCTEMRHAGDDRAVFLPGYEPMTDRPDIPNGRRKRL